MTEIQIYEKDGLYHNIVKKSSIMNGRYHVLPNGTADLNTNTISGIELPTNDYPLVGCLTPLSLVDPSFANSQWEKFSFRLVFLCNTYGTGDNQFKDRDHLTNTSMHSIPKDWSDMKTVAFSFINALEITTAKLRKVFLIDDRTPVRINRVTQIQNAKLSGVMLSFSGMLSTVCEYSDINSAAIADIIIPVTDHAAHKH